MTLFGSITTRSREGQVYIPYANSYPYLNVAKKYGVDYGCVLSYVNLMEKRLFNDLCCDVTYWETRAFQFLDAIVRTEIREVMRLEHARRGVVS